MNSLDSSKSRSLKDAILDALRAGQAEEPEEEATFVLRYVNQHSLLDPGKIDNILAELAEGVSPYHVIGEYPIPGARCTLLVPRDVMPPGSDTPGMILAIQQVANSCRPALLVDIGCGMGVLGVAALLASPDSRGVLIDVDMAACEATIANLARLGLSNRATVVPADSLACLAPNSVALLVGNLPFVPTDHIGSLLPRFSRHVPRRAVDGGRDGLGLFRRLLPHDLPVGTRRPAGVFHMLST